MNLTNNELKALRFAEKYGVIDYEVKDNIMVYYEKYPNEGTFKYTVDLKTMIEKGERLC